RDRGADPRAAVPVRDLRGRGVLGRDPARDGVVRAAPARAHERADPLDGAVGAGRDRLHRRGDARAPRPRAVRGVGVAGFVRGRRGALCGNAHLLQPARGRRPGAQRRRACHDPTPAAAGCAGRTLGRGVLGGIRADDRVVAAHRLDSPAAHRATRHRLLAHRFRCARRDGHRRDRAGTRDGGRRAPLEPRGQAPAAHLLGRVRDAAGPAAVVGRGARADARRRCPPRCAAAGCDGLRLRADRRLSLRAVPRRGALHRVRLRVQPLPRAAGAVPLLRPRARTVAGAGWDRDRDGGARRAARDRRGAARAEARTARARRASRGGYAMSDPRTDPDLERVLPVLEAVRAGAPLVHCITATVSMSLVADGLLAAGASPMMTETLAEAPVVTTLADALLINLGTLSTDAMDAIPATVDIATRQERPWVLDPTAIGIAPVRTPLARELLASRPTVVRGNASEVLTLAGHDGGG